MSKISFDYFAIKQRILNTLSGMSEWATFLDYGAIDNVVGSISNEMAYEIQYGEYNTMENFWGMARNRSSLLQMSPMHGFIVPRKQASSGVIRISTSSTFDESYDKNITIPKFFQFSGNEIYVCADDTYTLNANENYADINCMQGEVKYSSFIAEGIQYEEKTIYDDSIENSFFTLTVNNTEWKCVDSLYLYSSEDKVYQIRTLPDLSGITIRFGNDVFGKKLLKNDLVNFTYISTLGTEGNIYSSDIITTVESQAFDSNGKSVKLYCNNISKFIGGIDYPSLEYIREVSPKVYQTGNRASSRDDYYTVLRQMNFLSKVNVWGAYETLLDRKEDPWGYINSDENVVHLACLDSAYEPLSNAQKTVIIDKLYVLSDPTDLIRFEEVDKVPMVFHVDGKIINSSYTTAEVESAIKTALSTRYGIDTMNFGESVYNSDYIRLIDEVNGIDNHISYVELINEGYLFTSAYSADFVLPIYPIDPLSVIIYIKDTSDSNAKFEELARCDSNGNIVGSGIYVTTGSSISINNGNGYLIVTNGLTSEFSNYLIRISYQYIADDLINTSRSNILYYSDAIIDLYY